MTNKVNALIALSLLIVVTAACNASFTTANISNLTTGRTHNADSATDTFDVSDTIYAVANVANTSSKHKMNFEVTFDDVKGKAKGENALSQEIEFEGARPITLTLSVPLPGTYEISSTLFDETGKQVDRKTTKVKVTGSVPTQNEAEDAAS
jgi:hypothetical protein